MASHSTLWYLQIFVVWCIACFCNGIHFPFITFWFIYLWITVLHSNNDSNDIYKSCWSIHNPTIISHLFYSWNMLSVLIISFFTQKAALLLVSSSFSLHSNKRVNKLTYIKKSALLLLAENHSTILFFSMNQIHFHYIILEFVVHNLSCLFHLFSR